MALPYILAGVSALSSLIGDSIDKNNAEKIKDKQAEAYQKLLIPSNEMDKRADRVGDTVYTKAMGELNKGVFSGRGALNPETLKTIAHVKMATARADAEGNQYIADDSYNRQIKNKIAEVESTPIPDVNPMDAIFEGVGGYFAGKQLEMQEGLMNKEIQFYDEMIRDINNKKPISSSNIFMGMDDILLKNMKKNNKKNSWLLK